MSCLSRRIYKRITVSTSKILLFIQWTIIVVRLPHSLITELFYCPKHLAIASCNSRLVKYPHTESMCVAMHIIIYACNLYYTAYRVLYRTLLQSISTMN